MYDVTIVFLGGRKETKRMSDPYSLNLFQCDVSLLLGLIDHAEAEEVLRKDFKYKFEEGAWVCKADGLMTVLGRVPGKDYSFLKNFEVSL